MKKIAGNTYTTAEERPSATPSVSTEVWVEMGMRVKDIRARCVFQYDRDESGAAFKRIFLVREGLERLPLDDGETEVRCCVFCFSICPLYVALLCFGTAHRSFLCMSLCFASDERLGEALYDSDFTGSCKPLERETPVASHPPLPHLCACARLMRTRRKRCLGSSI